MTTTIGPSESSIPNAAFIEKYFYQHLKIKHLRLLVELGDNNTVAQVATKMQVSQPAVSKVLAELELGLGIQLFERAGRGIKPTAFGELFIRHAREVLYNLLRANEEICDLSKVNTGKVTVGIFHGLATTVLLSAIKSMKENWPNITIGIRENTPDQNMIELRAGKIDLFVGRVYIESDAEHLVEEILFEEPLVLVASTQHPLLDRNKIEWHELEKFPWLFPEKDSPTHKRLLRLMEQHKIKKPANTIECVSRNITIPLMSSSTTIGLLPLTDAKKLVAQGVLQILPLHLEALPAPIGMVWKKAVPIAPEVALFQDHLRRATALFSSEFLN